MTTRLHRPDGELGQGRHFLSKHRCPEADYLAVYDSDPGLSSSHDSAQPSPDLSQDGSTSAWSEEDLSLHLPPCALRAPADSPPSTATPTTTTCCCSDTGSFECVDVALEHQGGEREEERGRKTVPKRQIQLRRRGMWEQEEEGEEEKEVTAEASHPLHQRREMLLRQHSTPATFHQRSHDLPASHDLYQPTGAGQAERRQRLQKSLSLDETVSPCKTKMASCIIKNVLSKKMQTELQVLENAFAPTETRNNTKNSLYHGSVAHRVSAADEKNYTTQDGSANKKYATQDGTADKNYNAQHALGQSVVRQQSVSSRTQQKPLFKQNGVSVLASGLAGCEYQSTGRRRSEIAGSSAEEGEGEREGEEERDREGTERLSLQERGQTSPRDRLSCDSAKNTSAGQGGPEGRQDIGASTSGGEDEGECQRGQRGASKQQPPSPSAVQKGVDAGRGSSDRHIQQGGATEEREGGAVAGVVVGPGDLRFVSQSGNAPGPSGIFKGIAPVHVVRDMRSLVKNTYNLSFRNAPADAGIGREDGSPQSASQPPSRDILGVRKVSPPVTRTQVTEHASHYRGYVNRTPLNQSHDRVPNGGFTNTGHQVLPTSAGRRGSQPIGGQGQARLPVDPPTQPPRTEEAPAPQQSRIGKTAPPDDNKQRSPPLPSALPAYISPAGYPHQPESVPEVTSASQGQGLDLPPRSQPQSTILGFAAPSTPGCIPQPFLSSYFYTPGSLAYQALQPSTALGYPTLQPHLGNVSYIQAPILLQGPLPPDGYKGVRFSPPQTTGSGNDQDGGAKMVVLESPKQQHQHFLSGVQGFPGVHTESRGQGGGFSEMAAAHLYGHTPRHMLLDPESGRCFYVDTTPQPQRKMLFDPETCRYVEVYLPQQSVAPAAVTATAVPMPYPSYPSFHFPAMFAPQCLSLSVQPQQQESPHNAP